MKLSAVTVTGVAVPSVTTKYDSGLFPLIGGESAGLSWVTATLPLKIDPAKVPTPTPSGSTERGFPLDAFETLESDGELWVQSSVGPRHCSCLPRAVMMLSGSRSPRDGTKRRRASPI